MSDKNTKINFSDLPESFDPNPLIEKFKKELSLRGAPCKKHDYGLTNGWHVCKRCGKRRGIVLISDETYRRAKFTAMEMGLGPRAWKYIPGQYGPRDEERRLKLVGARVESPNDLVGFFWEEERVRLLSHLPKEEEE